MTTALRRIWTSSACKDSRTGVCSVNSTQHDHYDRNRLCKRKEDKDVCACVHMHTCFPGTKQETVHFMIIYKTCIQCLTKWWLFVVANLWAWKNRISPQHHSIYIGILSQLKSKVPTHFMTVALTSLPSLLNIFLLDSFAVYFYCVSLVYILANSQLIILSSFRTSFQGLFVWPCGNKYRTMIFLCKLTKPLIIFIQKKRKKNSLRD